MKEEVMGNMKKLGNSVLGYFGMSMDNFKMQQNEDGTYNVNGLDIVVSQYFNGNAGSGGGGTTAGNGATSALVLGAGGDGAAPGYPTGAGVGNPTGTAVAGAPSASGTGGLIILVVGGTLTVASGATVEAKGVNAASHTVAWQGASGGASGGGNILLLSAGAYTNNGTIDVGGGGPQHVTSNNYTNRSGGRGGNGSAQQGIIDTGVAASYGNLTLQSVASTAESAPTTGDIVMLIEDAAGTATINTDIKAYISRDGSAFSSAVTLTDEGDWGTNKRILAAHNVDISGITSGTSMKYKVTTHNQSESKNTKIHATSLAWA